MAETWLYGVTAIMEGVALCCPWKRCSGYGLPFSAHHASATNIPELMECLTGIVFSHHRFCLWHSCKGQWTIAMCPWSWNLLVLLYFLPKNTQDWSPLGWTGWISSQSKGLSRVFSNTTVQKHQFFGVQPSSQSNSHIHTWPQEKP